MKRKTKIKLRKIFQATYILTFFILSAGIAGNVELGLKTSLHSLIVWAICGILSIAKIIYHDLKYPGAKYVWH